MNVVKLNLVVYRIVGIAVSLFLLLGALGMFEAHKTIKGLVGVTACVLEIILQFKRPSIATWIFLVVIILFAMLLVGAIGNP